MILYKIVGKIFLSRLSCNKKKFKIFVSQIQKYCIFIKRDLCCLIISLKIPTDVVSSINNCVMGCGWLIYSNVFRKMMTHLPVTTPPWFLLLLQRQKQILNVAIYMYWAI